MIDHSWGIRNAITGEIILKCHESEATIQSVLTSGADLPTFSDGVNVEAFDGAQVERERLPVDGWVRYADEHDQKFGTMIVLSHGDEWHREFNADGPPLGGLISVHVRFVDGHTNRLSSAALIPQA